MAFSSSASQRVARRRVKSRLAASFSLSDPPFSALSIRSSPVREPRLPESYPSSSSTIQNLDHVRSRFPRLDSILVWSNRIRLNSALTSTSVGSSVLSARSRCSSAPRLLKCHRQHLGGTDSITAVVGWRTWGKGMRDGEKKFLIASALMLIRLFQIVRGQ
jgi:hypothetical protein